MSDAVMMGSRAGRGRVRRAGRGGGSLAPGMVSFLDGFLTALFVS